MNVDVQVAPRCAPEEELVIVELVNAKEASPDDVVKSTCNHGVPERMIKFARVRIKIIVILKIFER